LRTGTPVVDRREREDWRDGRVTWVLTTKLRWLADDGRTVRGVVGLTREIRGPVDTPGRYEDILDAIPALVFVKGPDLRFVYVNQAVATVLGRPKADIVGRTDAELIADEGQVTRFRADDLAVLGGPAAGRTRGSD